MRKESLIDTNEYIFYGDKRIWSNCFKRFLTGNVLPNGYVRVHLKCIDGKYRAFYWHRVIWYAFNGEIPDGYAVNHINEDKTDNRLSNLNLMTPKENNNWGTHNERVAATNRNHPLRSKPVVAVDKDENVVYEFASTREAERNGFDRRHVLACCNGKKKTHKGLRWYYKEEWEKLIWERKLEVKKV